MKRLFCLTTLLVAAAVTAFGQITIQKNGRLEIRRDGKTILLNDSLTLQNASWKIVADPLKAVPEIERTEQKIIYRWKTDNARLVRTIELRADGTESILYEAEFSPGITDGRYIELTLTAPANAWKSTPVSGKRTIVSSRTWIEVKPDTGTLYFDFTGSDGNWKFEEMRNVDWFGHLRLNYFSGYDPARGAKFTARLTITERRPETPQKTAAIQGSGDEYRHVKLSEEEKNAAPLLAAQLRIDPARILRSSTPRLFGFNNDWHGYEGLRPVDPASIDPDAEVNPVDPRLGAALEGVPLPLNRTAGTDSQLFRWRDAIGPNRDRKPFSLWFGQTGGTPRYYGLREHFNWYRQQYPEAEFIYVVKLYDSTPQESAALAEFLKSEGVFPAVWELGNEMDLGGAKHLDLPDYIDACRAHLEAIRSVLPDAQFAAHVITAPWDPSRAGQWRNWNQTVIRELGSDLRYLAFHPYYRGLAPRQMLNYLDELRDDIASGPNPALQVLNSEHAKWPPGYGSENWSDYWYQTHALVGVLDTAEWMLLMLNRPEVGAQTYHAFSAGPWGVVYRDKESGNYYRTGIAELFRFLEPAHHGNVVATTLSGEGCDPRGKAFHFTSCAILSEDGKKLDLYLNNRLPRSKREVAVQFADSNWTPVEMEILTAPALESHCTVDNNPFQRIRRAPDAGAQLLIPEKSLVRIRYARSE